jgi:ferredoxin
VPPRAGGRGVFLEERCQRPGERLVHDDTGWDLSIQSLLELAEACDVPVRWSCRTGVCHSCETGLIGGTVAYRPDPVEPPTDGNVLIRCSRPAGDIVIDL